MPTECNPGLFDFGSVEGRRVVAGFDGGRVTSDAGALLLGATDRAIRLIDRFAGCFRTADRRRTSSMRWRRWSASAYSASPSVTRILIDHDQLRHDPVLATLAGKLAARRPRCAPLAGKSTLNRLEHGTEGYTRYHKIGHDGDAVAMLFVELFLDAHRRPPKQITLDLDATDDPLHGHQEGRFFHGYYDCYCYLPLYVFCGRHLLAAKLRRSNIDASAGALDEVARIVAHIRRRWPKVRILLRADLAFAREELMAWCERSRVDYVFGLARNDRLVAAIAAEMAEASAECRATGRAARRFRDLRWSTLDSWSRRRRVIGKAEALPLGDNPRFIVTSLAPAEAEARFLYERLYCARGDMENRIKECQLDLFADRTSAKSMRANQLRLWFASMAYVLICALRRLGLAHTQFAQATCDTICLRLLKIGALVRISIRRIKVAMASAFPHQHEFALARALLSNTGR